MISPVEQYRALASKARQQAAVANLPQVQLSYLRSAEHFDALWPGLKK